MPEVSVIIPCFNEEKRISGLLRALLSQTFPTSLMEIIIADGMSTDSTRSIIQNFQQQEKTLNVLVIDNPRKIIPSALNLALQASSGEIIIRIDAHSIPDPDYIERCYSLLKQDYADNVGGVWKIMPGADTVIAKAIALAAAHPLGVGDANYRMQNATPAFVDTVPFGAYHKKTLTNLGGYNETLLSNEDYELNARIRKNGGRIWLDPAIRCTYFARHSLKTLAEQYWRYGYWKLQMLRRFPETIRIRQAIPPLFLLSILFLLLSSLLLPFLIYILIIEIIIYFLALFVGTVKTAITQHKPFAIWMAMVLSMVTMHTSWGASFLLALLQSVFTPK